MKHYKRILIEGNNPERFINICLTRKLNLKRIQIHSETEMSVHVRNEDFELFREIAGGRYRIIILEERGYLFWIKGFRKKGVLIMGLFIFIGIFFYQNLFISEIEVSGYESISEQAIISCLQDAGFYEGCRKNVSLEKVKLHLYEQFDNISWIGIKYKGNLAQVTIVETDYVYEKYKVAGNKPCNIVADRNGYINSVDPEQGIRAVNDGAYVREGDIIISGEIPLTKTTYDENEESENYSYVHAAGTVDAKVPVRLNYYVEATEPLKEKTGRKMVFLSVNNITVLKGICPYELSLSDGVTLINWVKPVRLKIQLNNVEEIRLNNSKIPEKDIKKMVLKEIHEFAKEKLPDNTQILNKSLNFTQEKNIIRIGVTLETLQEIGIEEEIIVDKSNRQSDQNDD